MEIDYRFKALEPFKSTLTDRRKTKDFLYWKSYKYPIVLKENGAVTHLDFQNSASGLLAVTTSTKVQIYNQVTSELIKTFSRFQDLALGANFRKDGKLLAAGGKEGKVRLFDIAGKIALRTFEGHAKAVHSVKFCNDLYKLYSVSDDKTVRLWDIATGKSLAIMESHEDYIRCAYTSPNSHDNIVTGSYDHTAKIWDIRNNSVVCSVNHGHPVESILVYPSATMMLTSGSDKVKIWDILQGGKLVATLSNHHKTITSMAFNHDSSRLLTAGLDKHVKIYDVSNFEVVHSMDYPSPILSLATSHNDRTLAVGMSDKTFQLRHRREVLKSEILEEQRRKKVLENEEKSKFRQNIYRQPQSNDIVIPTAKQQIFNKYDTMFRKFEYTKAVDIVLKKTHTVEEKMSVFSELIRRDVLKRALAGRNEKSILLILQVITKNISNPAYTSILLDVAESMVDVYCSEISAQSQIVQASFLRLRAYIVHEVEVQREMCALQGCLESLAHTAT